MFHVKHRMPRSDQTPTASTVELQALKRWLSSHSIEIMETAERRLQLYLQTLLQWNRRTNLVSRRDEPHLVERHVFECVALLVLVPLPHGAEILDLGTGAGFPGMVLKIVRSDLRMTLLESQRRRVLFLRHVVDLLRLSGVEVLCARAEELQEHPDHRSRYDFVTARAVASLDRLWQWSRSLLTPSGMLIAFKGGDVSAEIETLQRTAPARTRVIPFPEEGPFCGKKRKLILVQEESPREP